jgi:hypothetical protein
LSSPQRITDPRLDHGRVVLYAAEGAISDFDQFERFAKV